MFYQRWAEGYHQPSKESRSKPHLRLFGWGTVVAEWAPSEAKPQITGLGGGGMLGRWQWQHGGWSAGLVGCEPCGWAAVAVWWVACRPCWMQVKWVGRSK